MIKKHIYTFSFLLLLIACKKEATKTSPPTTVGTILTSDSIHINLDSISNITKNSASLYFFVTEGNLSAVDRGVIYGTEKTLTIDTVMTSATVTYGTGAFKIVLSQIEAGTTYFYKPFVKNRNGEIIYGDTSHFTTVPPLLAKVYIDSSSFSSVSNLTKYWDMLYPWGADHNGSARMYADNVSLLGNNTLKISALRVPQTEGKSGADPHLTIAYHSGAIHAKQKIELTDQEPYWVISGDFQVPTMVGSWPAFWITGADSWPPEIDMMEFKGSNTCWQNTVNGTDWQHTSWQTTPTVVSNAGEWHNYKMIIYRTSSTTNAEDLFIDGTKEATHIADFMNKPFWLIINMQMEGSSGSFGSGPQSAQMRVRNVYLASYNAIPSN